ncbi:hypothetical protein [Streptomyces sp. NPDC095817]|uniref:hypothetical protein n=1 Tax=unclassified Streptomyces TaxID=2593676 RepID=UPI00332273E7
MDVSSASAAQGAAAGAEEAPPEPGFPEGVCEDGAPEGPAPPVGAEEAADGTEPVPSSPGWQAVMRSAAAETAAVASAALRAADPYRVPLSMESPDELVECRSLTGTRRYRVRSGRRRFASGRPCDATVTRRARTRTPS